MEVRAYRIPRGLRATLATVELIRRAIDEASKDLAVRAHAIRIVRAAGVRPQDYRGELRALFDYCCHKLRYTRDPITAELVHSAPRLLGEIERDGATAGDCDDQSVLLGALAASIGFPIAIRIIGLRPGEFRHVHLRVLVGGRWIPADLTACPRHGLGFEARAPVERVFLLDGREITGMQYVGTLAGLGQGVFSEHDIARQVGRLGFSRYEITPEGQVMGYGLGGDLQGVDGFLDFVTAPFRAAGAAVGQVANVATQVAPLVSLVNPAAGAALMTGAQAGRMASGIVSQVTGGGGRGAPAPARSAPPPARTFAPASPPAPAGRIAQSPPQAVYRTTKATAPAAPKGTFFERHKWPLILGGVAAAAGGAFLLTRKKGRR